MWSTVFLHAAYAEYLRLCGSCANAEKARERLDELKRTPAVATVDYPAAVKGPRWEWVTTFKETGGKTGYKVSGSGFILSSTGARYVTSGRSYISRGEVVLPPGGAGRDSYWAGNVGSRLFCSGRGVFTWTGEDAGGARISMQVDVQLTCDPPK
jgi:hypothetical protein